MKKFVVWQKYFNSGKVEDESDEVLANLDI